MGRRLFESPPRDIVYNILDLVLVTNTNLTCKAAIRLSLTSKEFFRLVQKRSVLIYDYNALPEKARDKELVSLIPTLRRYHEENIHLDTFTFSKPYNVKLTNRDAQCIDLAVTKKGLKNLNLFLPDSYNLEGPVFEAESLVQLSLKGCRLQALAGVAWRNLKGLGLDGIRMSEEVFENIMRSCPLLENVKIHCCCWDNPRFHFRVSNLGNLKQLNIELGLAYQTIEVMDTPSLESILCGHTNLIYKNSTPDVRYMKSMNLPSPTHINLGGQEYPNLKRISLCNVRVDGCKFFIDFARKFPRLEVLWMKGDQNLLKIDISSPSLKEIHLLNLKALKEARFDVPNIVLFKFDVFVYRKRGVLPKVTFTTKSSSGRWISKIKLTCFRDIPSWFLKLEKFLSQFDRCSDISVTAFIRDDEVLNNHRNDRISFPGIIKRFREYHWEDWPEMTREAKRLKLSQMT